MGLLILPMSDTKVIEMIVERVTESFEEKYMIDIPQTNENGFCELPTVPIPSLRYLILIECIH